MSKPRTIESKAKLTVNIESSIYQKLKIVCAMRGEIPAEVIRKLMLEYVNQYEVPTTLHKRDIP